MIFPSSRQTRLTGWLLFLAVLAGIQPGLALAQVKDNEYGSLRAERARFKLYNACRPMQLAVGEPSNDAKKLGLTEQRVRVAAESRLRAARLYTEEIARGNGALLYVNANVVREVFTVDVKYHKELRDPVSTNLGLASTWQSGRFGTHGGDPGYIIQNLSEKMDTFLVEYLRVNEKDCRPATGR